MCPEPSSEPVRSLRSGSSRRRLAAPLIRLAPILSAIAALGYAEGAAAQTDINPPLPDVLLLVDTSGSMEYKVGSDQFPTCVPNESNKSEKSRWIDLVEVLSGSILDYRCESIDRLATSFRDGEYGTSGPLGVAPYDFPYENAYHRPLSGNCARGPGSLTSNVWDFPSTAFKEHVYNSASTSCTVPFQQSQDGILDSFERAIRFGLMTFDTVVDPETGGGLGYSGSSPNYADGVKGTWSYVWGQKAMGKPLGCLVAKPWEVGARNAAAPPWEGRLINFGDPSPGSTQYLTKKEQIEKVLVSSRPYGPTPIAGLIRDARDFLTKDDSKDPLDNTLDFGPVNDPWINDKNVTGGCRKRYIVLLSDGQPNMDLRPECGTGSDCPFPKPEDVALELRGGDRPIQTFVVGFSLSKFTVKDRGEVTCNDLLDADFDEQNQSALCNSKDPQNVANTSLQACCALNRIAVAGGSGERPRAFFADNRDSLASALSEILTKTTAVTSRTQPVVASGGAGAQGFRFYSSVRPVSFQPWVGILQRQRYECEDRVAKPMPVRKDQQDDFAANLNADKTSRIILSVRGTSASGLSAADNESSLRPYYSPVSGAGDGAGSFGAVRYGGSPAGFVADTSAQTIKVTDTTCSNPKVAASACRNRYMNWVLGLENDTKFSRCKGGDQCYLLGDILHSTPRVVGPPSDFVQDESYDAFAHDNRERPLVLYTSTNDGFLHAFKVATSDPTDKVEGPGAKQNELWAFVPPAILPHLRDQFPFTHQALLDGAPVIKDVVATQGTDMASKRFERSPAEAKVASGSWRTILLQSFGTQSPAGGGYFAVDVTDPLLSSTEASANTKGPRFLWQLTKDAGGRPLFGDSSTPAIATLFFDPAGGSSPKEIAVALLPGGAAPQGNKGPGNDGCPSASRTFIASNFGGYAPRSKVLCYDASAYAARSLTIVRLDTGEIVRSFRQAKTEVIDTDLKQKVTVADLDSPITGQPVVFPSETGAVSDRAYVGDQDGRLWKLDLSSSDPSKWKMALLFDTFPRTFPLDGGTSYDFGSGQPIVLPPVLSVDAVGDVTINVATGDQDTIGASATTKNYVWSLTERTDQASQTRTSVVNWYQRLDNGERVVGPMSLFNSQLFFTTYAPPSADVLKDNACNSGTSKVWGMDYLRPFDLITRASGGLPRLPKADSLVQYLTGSQVVGGSNGVIFGVSVAQLPSCTETSTSQRDDFLGYSSTTERTISHVSPGKFQLVMHVGGLDTTGSGGGNDSDLATNVRTIDLPPPPSAARVDSWAALLE